MIRSDVGPWGLRRCRERLQLVLEPLDRAQERFGLRLHSHVLGAREQQLAAHEKHGIAPESVARGVSDIAELPRWLT